MRQGRLFRTAILLGAGFLLAGAILARRDDPDPAALRALYAGPPTQWPQAELGEGAVFAEFGALPQVRRLEGKDAAMAALGAQLFNDPGLSGSGQIACASCHNRELGFGDGLRTSFGHGRQRGQRNAQSLFTVAWMHELFWDGRVASLEDQANVPLVNPIEMAGEQRKVERWINRQAQYREKFQALFGKGRVNSRQIVIAIAAFERTLRPPRSRWDRMLAEGAGVFTDEELKGLHLFRTKAGCANCHNGPLFSDQRYHNLGLTFYGRTLEDLGRYAVTRAAADVGRFRTPSLRAVRRTGPFMHNGIFPTLEGTVNFYNAGGAHEKQPTARPDPDAPRPALDPLVKPLNLTAEERRALVAFLETL